MRSGWHAFEELGESDFRDLDPERTVAILPVGAIEQHGPHLPLGTDAILLDGILERSRVEVARTHGAGATFLRLPTQRIGSSLEHTDFAGTLHVDPAVLLSHWIEIGRSLARGGVRKLAIVNSHGGQPQIVDLVAQRLRADHSMLVARVQTFLFGVPGGTFHRDELRHGFHGGEIETSMMLALRPDLVDMEAAEDFESEGIRIERTSRVLAPEGAAGLAWQAQDLHPSGATGNAAGADAPRGEQTLRHVAARLAGALFDLAELPLSGLRERSP